MPHSYPLAWLVVIIWALIITFVCLVAFKDGDRQSCQGNNCATLDKKICKTTTGCTWN